MAGSSSDQPDLRDRSHAPGTDTTMNGHRGETRFPAESGKSSERYLSAWSLSERHL
jgi:hypothetical protein